MKATIEIITAGLARTHPGWNIWTVHRVVGGVQWCARPADESIDSLTADSPEQLSAAIRQARKAAMKGDK